MIKIGPNIALVVGKLPISQRIRKNVVLVAGKTPAPILLLSMQSFILSLPKSMKKLSKYGRTGYNKYFVDLLALIRLM